MDKINKVTKTVEETTAGMGKGNPTTTAPPRGNPGKTRYPEAFINDSQSRDYPVFVAPPEYLPITSCRNCGGSGFMYAFYAIDNGSAAIPRSYEMTVKYISGLWYQGYNRAEPCPVCRVNYKERQLVDICGLHGPELDISIDDLKPITGKTNAIKTARLLIQHNPQYVTGFVTFYGSFGVGKTYMTKAIINHFRLAGVMSVYARMADILAEVRATFGDNTRGATEYLIDQYRGYKVLAVDEIDRIKLTEWAAEIVFRLMDARYEARNEILTVICTNSNPFEPAPEWAYLASRMTGGTAVEVGGVDMRQL